MFEIRKPQSTFSSAVSMGELIYHAVVRQVRKTHRNALASILINMLQAAIFIAVFYIMFSILGLRGAALRGDFLIYIMTGIFLFLTHTKTLGAVVGSEGPTSAMMLHAPMNTVVAILAAALGTLYIQVLSLFVILFLYHVAVTPVIIEDPVGAFTMLLIAWFSGLGIGVVLLSLKPWFPSVISIVTTIYQRANMIASGKMFVANTLPGYMLAMFDWNPLFHCIDQSRGFAFINYVPRHSSVTYPLYFGLAFLMIGLMLEFFTRKNLSASWGARS